MPLTRTATTEGAARGIVTVRAPHELNDNEVVWLQDALVNQAGLIVRRNGLPAVGTFNKAVVTNAAGTARPVGVVSTYDPAGTLRIGILYFDTSALGTGLYMSVYNSAYTFIQRHMVCAVKNNGPVTGGFGNVVHYAALNDGGVAIYAADGLGVAANGGVGVWYGGAIATSTGNTGSVAFGFNCTVTRNSAVVTANAVDVAKLTPGTIIYSVGVVRSIDTATTFSLIKPYHGITNAAFGASMGISMFPNIYNTIGLASGVAGGVVSGYGTKFKSMVNNVLGSSFGAYSGIMVSEMDDKVIADVTWTATTTETNFPTSTVAKSSTLEPFRLFASVNDEPSGVFAPLHISGSSTSQRIIGGLVTSWNGYQIWANSPTAVSGSEGLGIPSMSGRFWLGGPTYPYEIDQARADGSWDDLPSAHLVDADIVAVGSTNRGVVLCKRKSTYFFSGEPGNYSLDKILDDGALGPQAICNYQGGVIWAGKNGIYYCDGQSAPDNLVEETILPTYRSMVASFLTGDNTADAIDVSQAKYTVRCFVHLDHLFVCFGSSVTFGIMYSGNTSTLQQSQTIAMYLPNRAVNFWSNFRVNGFLPPNNVDSSGYVLLVSSTNTYHLVNLDSIIDPDSVQAGRINDAFTVKTCSNGGTTPSFYMETKRYDLGDALNRKVWKGLALEAMVSNFVFPAAGTATLKVDYVLGLNTAGTAVATTFLDTTPALSTLPQFKAQRIKARARNQFLGFRLYEDPAHRANYLQIGPWQMIYKPGRPGAI